MHLQKMHLQNGRASTPGAGMNYAVLQEESRTLPQETSIHIWENVKKRLKAKLGEMTFKSWFNSLHYERTEARQILFTVPTRFMREWIMAHYADDILRLWKVEDPSLFSVQIRVQAVAPNTPAASLSPVKSFPPVEFPKSYAPKAVAGATLPAGDAVDSSWYVGAPLDPRFTFENFVVGKPNELAHAAARRVSDNDTVMQGCNPLFLYGGVGLGKTHLMHSIAWQIRRTNPGRKVIYLSAEKFMYQFIRALRFKEALAFKEQFRSVDVLMIDDVQFISGKDSTQEEFFHTFNALVDQNKQLIISCDRSPSDLEGMEERVRSRLGWGLVADIHAATYELRLGILQSKVEKMQGVFVPPKVLEFLAHKITSNARELEGALNRVVAHSTLVGRAITLENTHEVLHDMLRANDRRVTIEEIQKQVANHLVTSRCRICTLPGAHARSPARGVRWRCICQKSSPAKSLPEIGSGFCGKDHTTVMHAVKRIEDLCKSGK